MDFHRIVSVLKAVAMQPTRIKLGWQGSLGWQGLLSQRASNHDLLLTP